MIEMNQIHRMMLEHVVRGRIYTWAGEPLRKGAGAAFERFNREEREAFADLRRAGFVHREHITAAGYRVADAWGLDPDVNLKGRVHS